MNIKDVKTSMFIGEFKNENVNWNFIYNTYIDKSILTNNGGRVYFIVVDGVIKKIGGSQSKGGIKSTIGPYKSAATGGNPSLRSFGINLLIKEELEKGSKVELYMIISETIKTEVCGLFGVEIIEVSPFKEMETKCLKDYYSVEKKYPDWNFQENNEIWYERIREKYDYVKNAK